MEYKKYYMLVTSLLLLYAAYWFFKDGKTVEMMLVFILIELRHFRYIWHRGNDATGKI